MRAIIFAATILSYCILIDVFEVVSCFLVTPQHSRRQKSSLGMVRNIDLAEAIIFYGESTLLSHNDDGSPSLQLLDGIKNLIEECERDDTAIVAILSSESTTNTDIISILPDTIYLRTETQSPPNPRDLWEAIHSFEIVPKGFGGSSGFGRRAGDPERPPMPRHCVVFCHTADQCRAARYCGMRCLCLGYDDDGLADAVVDDFSWDSIYMDDIATPGAYWLNPPHPKDDFGNAVDPEAVMNAYENQEETDMMARQQEEGDELSEDQLAAILADIDPL